MKNKKGFWMKPIFLSILFIGAILVCSENRMVVQAEPRGELSGQGEALPLTSDEALRFAQATNQPPKWFGPKEKPTGPQTPDATPVTPPAPVPVTPSVPATPSTPRPPGSMGAAPPAAVPVTPPPPSMSPPPALRRLKRFQRLPRHQKVQGLSLILTMRISTR